MTRLLLAAAATLAAVAAHAADLRSGADQPPQPLPLLIHNGSTMLQSFNPASGRLLIQYQIPRPAMAHLVRPGTVLIDAQVDRTGPWVQGVAYVFSAFCPPTPYRVVGEIHPDGVLVLRGPAPVLDTWCRVVFMAETQNAMLVFNPISKIRNGAAPMTDEERQDHVIGLVNQINNVLSGEDAAEAQTALTMVVACQIIATTEDKTLVVQMASGFANQLDALVRREDILEWIKHSITYVTRTKRNQ